LAGFFAGGNLEQAEPAFVPPKCQVPAVRAEIHRGDCEGRLKNDDAMLPIPEQEVRAQRRE
jgi:hypothetical protein